MSALAQVLLGINQTAPVFTFADVKALYHFEGANNDVTTTDSSLSSRAITLGGAAKIRTAASGGTGGLAKWGTSSLYLDGSASTAATIADSPSLDFGTGDFTIEGWFASNVSGGGNRCLFAIDANSNIEVYSKVSTGHLVTLYDEGVGIIATGNAFTFDNAFRHICLMRKAGTFYLFQSGVMTGSYNGGASTASINPTSLLLGMYTGGVEPYIGNIDDFRVSLFAVYPIAGFTPPAAQFPDS